MRVERLKEFVVGSAILMIIWGGLPLTLSAQSAKTNVTKVTLEKVEQRYPWGQTLSKKFFLQVRKGRSWAFFNENGKVWNEACVENQRTSRLIVLQCSLTFDSKYRSMILNIDLNSKQVMYFYDGNRKSGVLAKVLDANNSGTNSKKTDIKQFFLEKTPGANATIPAGMRFHSRFKLRNTKGTTWEMSLPNGNAFNYCFETGRAEFSVDMKCRIRKVNSNGFDEIFIKVDQVARNVRLQSGAVPWKFATEQWARDGKPLGPNVYFHLKKGGMSLAEAQDMALKKGWVIANAAEVKRAWEVRSLNSGLFGMLDDGRFAVPVQQNTKYFSRGPNIGARGGNQGFFYVKKEAVSRKQVRTVRGPVTRSALAIRPPTPAEKAKLKEILDTHREMVLTTDRFPEQKFFLLCNNNTGNPMLDGWGKRETAPLLRNAQKAYLASKGLSTLSDTAFRSELSRNGVMQFEFAPFMIRAFWDALTVRNPQAAEREFRKKFNLWAACDETKIAKMTLTNWEEHLEITNPSSTFNTVFGNKPNYSSPFGALIDTKTNRGTIKGFLPLENPLYLGSRGKEALAMMYQPITAASLPEFENSPLRPISGELTGLASHVGFLGGRIRYGCRGCGTFDSFDRVQNRQTSVGCLSENKGKRHGQSSRQGY